MNVNEGYTNPGCQIEVAIKCCMVKPNIHGALYGIFFMSWLWNLEFRGSTQIFWKFVHLHPTPNFV